LSFIWYFPAKTWSNTEVASAAALVVIISLYMLDCLLNNQPNPIFTLATGSISGLVVYESSKYYSPRQRSIVSPNNQK
ncbi:MAG: O-antigen ligase domain-containing protein, partial [Cyanobacteria bacterium J06631_2]